MDARLILRKIEGKPPANSVAECAEHKASKRRGREWQHSQIVKVPRGKPRS